MGHFSASVCTPSPWPVRCPALESDLSPPGEQEIDGRSLAYEIDAIAGSVVDAHLGHPFADRFAITEVAEACPIQARGYARSRLRIGETLEPSFEPRRPDKREHARSYLNGYAGASRALRAKCRRPQGAAPGQAALGERSPGQGGALANARRARDILGSYKGASAGRAMDADCVNVGYWTKLEDGRIACSLCPRLCKMRPGQRGLCFVRRAREDGEGMELTAYGRSTGFCVDPIEKKPLNHFLPGSSVLSFGTAGCNLACSFCQNWDISKSREIGAPERARHAGHDRARRRAAQLRERRLHLQRSGHLHGIRARHGGRLPRGRREERRGHRGLYL